jgi:hypothetical protein
MTRGNDACNLPSKEALLAELDDRLQQLAQLQSEVGDGWARIAHAVTHEDPLARLAANHRAMTVWEHRANEAVRQAREAGASWSEIGKEIGVTKQAAWQRFAGMAGESSAVVPIAAAWPWMLIHHHVIRMIGRLIFHR